MRHLRWLDLIAVNFFWLGLNIRNNAVGSIILPYLVVLFVPADIKNTALGGLNFAGLVIAMLVQPAAGLISDRNMSPFGRRRPFILVGVLLDLLFLAAIGLSWNFTSLLIAVLLQQFSANISHGPLQGLIPDLVPEKQRGLASGIKAIFELLPVILVGLTIASLIGSGNLGWAIIATGAALLITMLLTLVWVKEEPLQVKPEIEFWPNMARVLGMLAGIVAGMLAGLVGGGVVGGIAGLITWLVWGARVAQMIGVSLGVLAAMLVAVIVGVRAGVAATLGKKKNEEQEKGAFTWWIINRLLFLAAITSIQRFAPYFLMYAFHISINAAADLTGKLMVMVGLFTIATAIPGGWLSDHFGHRRVIGVSGIVAGLGGFLLLVTVWTPNLALIYVAGAILGLSTGLFMTANWALGTGLVPKEEAGRYLGISNLAGAGAGMVGAGIGGPAADYLNGLLPGLGYFVLFACYGMLFLSSALSLKGIVLPKILPAGVEAGIEQWPASPAAAQAGPVETGER